MDIEEMVKKWKSVIVDLALAHDKVVADRAEAKVESCLTPLLAAPIRDIRIFTRRLLEELKADTSVPFLVWRSYEAWVQNVVELAPDADIKELKLELAREIVVMVEADAKEQLPEAMIRALQWRSPKQLEKVREVVTTEKQAGRKARLRGRESCLFLEVGGTEDEPEVCIQI